MRRSLSCQAVSDSGTFSLAKYSRAVVFFDLNPSKRRDLFDSPCHHFVRLSYGPKMETLKSGLDGIERIVKRYVLGPIFGNMR